MTDLRKTINLARLLHSPLADWADVDKALLAAARKRTPVTTEQIRGAITRRQPVKLHPDLDRVVDQAILMMDPLVEQLLAAGVDPARVVALASATRT